MAEIHSFIYGIDSDFLVRKVTVSRETGATYITLNPPHGSDAVSIREIVENGRAPPQVPVVRLGEAAEVPADLDESAVGEKIRADLEVKAVARKQASG
jgi:hypothetical protein